MAETNVTYEPGIQHTEFEAYLQKILKGEVMIPNWQPLEYGVAANALAAGGSLSTDSQIHYTRNPDKPEWTHRDWTRCYISWTQGGQFDGSGYLIRYNSGKAGGVIGRFQICQHEVVNTSTPQQRMRGWNKQYCSKCNLNLSVDSSD